MFYDLLPSYRYFLLKMHIFVLANSDQDPDPRWSGSRIRISIEIKSWIRIRIETNADTQHWQKRYAALHLNSIKGHEMWRMIHKRTDPGFLTPQFIMT
jgi:hypothetical protein